MFFTNAKEVINHLYSLPHLHAKSDLSYIKRILRELGNPQKQIKTIHVTGTNGKGSTCYYLSNLLIKAGQKTGLFVSPYVYVFNERIQLNGENIPDDKLVELANQVEQALAVIRKKEADFSLVTFEYETVMAFLYFAQEHCDYAVIEVGIGGQHDKTNVIVPELSIITTVGLDHEKIIGPTLADIAREKSGVIKYQRPVVLGNVPRKVMPILRAKAKAMEAPVFLLNRDFQVKQDKQVVYLFRQHHLRFLSRPLVESYDIGIALTAFFLLGLALTKGLIEEAINQTRIPGRYHLLSREPTIILDGAHNVQAMTNLLSFVHDLVKQKGGQVKALVTMMKDKDLEQVFSLFKPEDKVMLTTINYPRAAKLADFPSAVRERYPYNADYLQAFKQIKQSLTAEDIFLVTGSFYLVGAILNAEE